MKRTFILFLVMIGLTAFSQPKGGLAEGDKAIDFSLQTLDGKEVTLSKLYKKNSVVLVVLRGWPGYQCPICTRQVGGLVAEADKLAAHDARILLIYPGPSEQLQEHAKEFSGEFDLPEHFYFAIDPDYSMINKYGLRWDALKETAYPSAFVIDKNGKVVFAKISETHGGRAKVEEILEALK